MKTWIIYTHSGSEYVVTENAGEWRFGARTAAPYSKGERFLGITFRIHGPDNFPPIPGTRLWVYGRDDTFPSSSLSLRTSAVTRVEEVQ